MSANTTNTHIMNAINVNDPHTIATQVQQLQKQIKTQIKTLKSNKTTINPNSKNSNSNAIICSRIIFASKITKQSNFFG